MGRKAAGKASRFRGVRWLLVVAWMGLIFFFSSQTYQQQNMQPELHRLLPDQTVERLFSDVRFDYAGKEVSVRELGAPAFLEFFVRKGAHFGIYLMLAVLVSWALVPLVRSPLVRFLLPVAFGLAYASTDELHQYFTGDRTPLVQDVLLDGFGALCGALIVLLVWRIRRKDRSTPSPR
ncbi:VanZ family protein [Gorillibacterium sp. sgz500922]|uniref:VanZ family protein n=1 Tax=Gorillibacterium sp. sgz500922 TaxID=3446694 RepID=UPI003F6813FD